MPTERNNRQSSEMPDSKCEEVAVRFNGEDWLWRHKWSNEDHHRRHLSTQVAGEFCKTSDIILELQRETRRETLLEAAEICNMVCEKIAAAKNQAGNTEEGRALQRCVWTAFACEQQILLLIDNDAKKAAELERKAKEI